MLPGTGRVVREASEDPAVEPPRLDKCLRHMKMKLKVMFKITASWAVLGPLLLSTIACSGDPGGAAPFPPEPMEVAKNTRVTYAEIVLASYEDSLELAAELDTSLRALVDEPSEENLEAAREAWLASREPYLQTEVYRFYDGPIDNPEDGPEGLLNAWPLDENYIDYVADDESAGIINDLDAEITPESLAAANEMDGEKNISTGYHSVEFLLWGQDEPMNDGPGERPYTDYVTDGSGTAENQDRRGEYLLTVSELMNDDLSKLVTAWEPGSANYRQEFLTVAPEVSLQRMLTGMILLSGNETGGERLQAALDTGEQEDEHSCFSDNTHRDMIQDVQGVMNVWTGTYTRVDGSTIEGTGVDEVVRAEDKALAYDIDEKLDECFELANALHKPFDREIATDNPEGRERVEALIVALNELSDLFEDAFVAFDLEVPDPP
jgi:putative iron-regulated protein